MAGDREEPVTFVAAARSLRAVCAPPTDVLVEFSQTEVRPLVGRREAL
jgi:hypothetical protein